MRYSEIIHSSFLDELEKVASLSSVFQSGVNKAKNLYNKTMTHPVVVGASQGGTKGLGGIIGGATKGVGKSMNPTSNVGKQLKLYGDAIGNVAEQAAYKRGGIVKKPTVARLAEDGDPEAVVPLGNDKADIKNRKRVVKKALRLMKKHKQKNR